MYDPYPYERFGKKDDSQSGGTSYGRSKLNRTRPNRPKEKGEKQEENSIPSRSKKTEKAVYTSKTFENISKEYADKLYKLKIRMSGFRKKGDMESFDREKKQIQAVIIQMQNTIVKLSEITKTIYTDDSENLLQTIRTQHKMLAELIIYARNDDAIDIPDIYSLRGIENFKKKLNRSDKEFKPLLEIIDIIKSKNILSEPLVFNLDLSIRICKPFSDQTEFSFDVINVPGIDIGDSVVYTIVIEAERRTLIFPVSEKKMPTKVLEENVYSYDNFPNHGFFQFSIKQRNDSVEESISIYDNLEFKIPYPSKENNGKYRELTKEIKTNTKMISLLLVLKTEESQYTKQSQYHLEAVLMSIPKV